MLGKRKSGSTTIPAPTKGLVTNKPMSAMGAQEALLLDNWIAAEGDVRVREGAVNHSTPREATYKFRKLIPFNGTGGRKLLGFGETAIYDVTSPGTPVSSEAVTPAGGVAPCFTQFGFGGQSQLFVADGNALRLYNGTTWTTITGASSPPISNITTASIRGMLSHKGRLWMCVEGSAGVYYSTVGALGAMTFFTTNNFLRRGGSIIAMTTWSVDTGTGADDLLILFSSEGEVLMYAGTDPSDSSKWALVGSYFIGDVVDSNCILNFGADVLVLTSAGLYPLSRLLKVGNVRTSDSLTYNIEVSIRDAVARYRGYEGWGLAYHSELSLILLTVPVLPNRLGFIHFAMNTNTGAWSRITGWEVHSLTMMGSTMYAAGELGVDRIFEGSMDYGGSIRAQAIPAFSYFGQRGKQKHVKLVRPIYTANRAVYTGAQVLSDFSLPSGGVEVDNTEQLAEGSVWGTAVWGTSVWGGSDASVQRLWNSYAGYPGYAITLRFLIESQAPDVAWTATNFIYEEGGLL